MYGMNGWGMGPRGPMVHRRPMGFYHRPVIGGLFLLPGLMFGGIFGLYAILAVLNVAGVVIGSVFSVLASLFGAAMEGIGSVGSIMAGAVIGLVLYNAIRRRRNAAEEE